jgi:hypothetical protein
MHGMIEIRTSDSNSVEIFIQTTSPIVYLDHCVIRELITKDDLGEQFRDLLIAKGGTFYWSWANLLEIAGLGIGPTYDKYRNYMESLGRHFALLECMPQQVIDREEEATPGQISPAVDLINTRQLLRSWTGLSELNLGVLIDELIEPGLATKYKQLHRTFKSSLKATFDHARSEYRQNKEAKKNIESLDPTLIPGAPPTKFLYKALRKCCITTNDRFNESDVLDFYHTVVSVAYSDFVILDKKWARRVNDIRDPNSMARVFDVTQVPSFLTELSAYPDSPASNISII